VRPDDEDEWDDSDDGEDPRRIPPKRNESTGHPHGLGVRSLRTVNFNIKLHDDEIWEWKTRPGVQYLHMNGIAVEALKALYLMDGKLLASAEAKLAKERVLGCAVRKRQVATKFMNEEIEFWKHLARLHGMPPNALLMWAFTLIDLVEEGGPVSGR
jgi:hypothetical protein